MPCAGTNWAPWRRDRITDVEHKPTAIVVHVCEAHEPCETIAQIHEWMALPAASRPPGSKASSVHYAVSRAGEIFQYVRDENRAYHAGRLCRPSWPHLAAYRYAAEFETPPMFARSRDAEVVNPNFWTLGIRLEGSSERDWTEPLIVATRALISELCNRWAIDRNAEQVISHRALHCDACMIRPDDLARLLG